MDLGRLAKDSALAAFVALILAIPLAGFSTNQAGAGVNTRFSWVAIAVVVVFLGRFVLGLKNKLALGCLGVILALIIWFSLPAPQRAQYGIELIIGGLISLGIGLTASRIAFPDITVLIVKHQRTLGWIGLGAAIVWPFMPFASQYSLDLATAVLIYMMLGWGLGVVVGLAGLLNLGYAAFYAVGAYTLALTSAYWGLGFWEALPIAGVVSAAVGILLALPVLRLRGDYLAIVTLGFGEIIRIILINWQSFTYGPNGVNGLPRPTFFGLPLAARAPGGGKTFAQFLGIDFNLVQRYIFIYFVTLALALLVNLFIRRLRRLPVGRAWEALREDEIATRALGINPVSAKLSAFAVGALLAGFAGVFFATRQGFVSPESFNFQESATVLAIVVLGGMGSQLGIAVAAIILVTLPEFGRDLAQFRMLLFGAAMVGIMIWRPRGLFSIRTPSIHLGKPQLSEPPK